MSNQWQTDDGIMHKAIFAKARWRDPCTGRWKGPDPVLI